MRTTIQRIAAVLNDIVKPNDPPRELRKVAVEACVSLGMPGDDAIDYAHDNEDKLRDASVELIRRHQLRAEPVNFEFNADDPYLIQGSCYALPGEDASLRLDKEKRANAPEIIAAIDALSEREFEYLCGVLLTCLKVSEPFVTRTSGDQGVDFFGKVDFGEFVRGTSQLGPVTPNLSVWVVGQAKRVKKTKVTTAIIRELVGSVELAKSRISADGGRALTDLTVRVCEPIFYFIVTSGVFTEGSDSLMQEAGIIGFDGKRLAAFLADHGVGLDEERKFDLPSFKAAISQLKGKVKDPRFA